MSIAGLGDVLIYFQTERNKALSFSLSISDGEKAVLQAIQAIQVYLIIYQQQYEWNYLNCLPNASFNFSTRLLIRIKDRSENNLSSWSFILLLLSFSSFIL